MKVNLEKTTPNVTKKLILKLPSIYGNKKKIKFFIYYPYIYKGTKNKYYYNKTSHYYNNNTTRLFYINFNKFSRKLKKKIKKDLISSCHFYSHK